MKNVVKYNYKIELDFLNGLISHNISIISCWELKIDYTMDGIFHSKSFSIRVGDFNNPKFFNISSDYFTTPGTGTTFHKFLTSIDNEIKYSHYNSDDFEPLKALNEIIYHSGPIKEIEIYEMEYCENDNGNNSDTIVSDAVLLLKTENLNFGFSNSCGALGGIDFSTVNSRIELMIDDCKLRLKI